MRKEIFEDATLYLGDCLEVMAEMEAGSVDAVVTDPPYGLHFMGEDWDRFSGRKRSGYGDGNARPHLEAGSYDHRRNAEFQEAMRVIFAEALRVLKPGGHVLAFGGPRTFHRLTCGIEDAGFEIRDVLCWLFGQGFPKNLDAERAIAMDTCSLPGRHFMRKLPPPDKRQRGDHVCFATTQSLGWDGWGTALKPGWEPIVLARKPFPGPVGANVAQHGTGALNIEGCRLAGLGRDPMKATFGQPIDERTHGAMKNVEYTPQARWPANVVHDGSAEVLEGFEACGAGERPGASSNSRGHNSATGGPRQAMFDPGAHDLRPGPADTGSAARFFYCAKASPRERNAGLEGFEEKAGGMRNNVGRHLTDGNDGGPRARNPHPTVKPVRLMQWLVRMVAPPGAVVLDPFVGSGTTGCAAALEGVRFIGIEQSPEYYRIAEARIVHWTAVAERAARIARIAAAQEKLPLEDLG